MGLLKKDSNTTIFYSDPQINQVSNLDWLWQIFKHRDASIRIMGYQMASIIATSEQGASLLIKNQALELWTQFMEIVLDRIESYQVKDYAMRTLTHLLRLGTNRNSTWYGPIFQERISGLKLNGEASLLPFLGRDRPRFFDQVGHQTTYAYIRNKHFFNKSCHRQTYQNYEQPSQNYKICTFKVIFHHQKPTESF